MLPVLRSGCGTGPACARPAGRPHLSRASPRSVYRPLRDGHVRPVGNQPASSAVPDLLLRAHAHARPFCDAGLSEEETDWSWVSPLTITPKTFAAVLVTVMVRPALTGRNRRGQCDISSPLMELLVTCQGGRTKGQYDPSGSHDSRKSSGRPCRNRRELDHGHERRRVRFTDGVIKVKKSCEGKSDRHVGCRSRTRRVASPLRDERLELLNSAWRDAGKHHFGTSLSPEETMDARRRHATRRCGAGFEPAAAQMAACSAEDRDDVLHDRRRTRSSNDAFRVPPARVMGTACRAVPRSIQGSAVATPL